MLNCMYCQISVYKQLSILGCHITGTCPAWLEFYESARACYGVFPMELSWPDAMAYCKTIHKESHLVDAQTEAEQDIIQELTFRGCKTEHTHFNVLPTYNHNYPRPDRRIWGVVLFLGRFIYLSGCLFVC